MKIGDKIRCINAEGVEGYGLTEGFVGVANSVVELPGDDEYLTVDIGNRFVIVSSSRFEVIEEEDEVSQDAAPN